MIHRLIELSLRNRGLIIVLYLGLALWGYWALIHTPIDAIPDLSENQVIVFTDWTGRSPQEVEDQVTYPLVTNLQGLAGVRVVRASSAFGFSMINVIFEDNIDLYFARTRVLERLNLVTKQLPEGVVPTLGPRNRCRTDLLIHARIRSDKRLAYFARLVCSLSVELSARCSGSGLSRRLCAAVSDRCRSEQAARLQHPAVDDCPGSSALK